MIKESECIYTGGGIWLSCIPFAEEDKPLLLVVSNENLNEYAVYNNLYDYDSDELFTQENMVESDRFRNNLRETIRKPYKEALCLMLDNAL